MDRGYTGGPVDMIPSDPVQCVCEISDYLSHHRGAIDYCSRLAEDPEELAECMEDVYKTH